MKLPVYREGLVLTDNLEIDHQVCAYVTQPRIEDPMGHLDAYHIHANGTVIHLKDYY